MFTYHCTVLHGLIGNPGAWLQTHKPVASHFSRSTLCFGGVSLVVLAKKSTPEDNSFQIAVNRSLEHVALFSLFFLSSFLFKSDFFGLFFRGLFSQVERGPEEAEFSALGWSPPSLSLSD